MTNLEIYNLALKLNKVSNDLFLKSLPVIFSFYLSKNKSLILQLGEEIEKIYKSICEKYQQYNENNQLVIPKEKIEIANKEINELMSLTQEVKIYKVKIKDLPADLNFTIEQMDAISFMIDENE